MVNPRTHFFFGQDLRDPVLVAKTVRIRLHVAAVCLPACSRKPLVDVAGPLQMHGYFDVQVSHDGVGEP